MAAVITMNDDEAQAYFRWLENQAPAIVRKISKEFVNNMAFAAKDETPDVISRTFSTRNSGTHKYLNRAVSVKKAVKASDPSLFGVKSATGAKRNQFNREILIRQENGGAVRQLNNKGGYRKHMLTQGRAIHGKRTPKMAGKTASAKKIANKKQQTARAIAIARRKSKQYASTPFGMYKVLKRKSRKITGYTPDKSIRTSKRPFIKKIVTKVVSRKQEILTRSVRRVMNKERQKAQKQIKQG